VLMATSPPPLSNDEGGTNDEGDNDDSTPHHGCKQLLAGWIWGAEEATHDGGLTGTTQHKEPGNGATTHLLHVAVYFVFSFLLYLFLS
jgi:hypothetical protein